MKKNFKLSKDKYELNKNSNSVHHVVVKNEPTALSSRATNLTHNSNIDRSHNDECTISVETLADFYSDDFTPVSEASNASLEGSPIKQCLAPLKQQTSSRKKES